MSFFVCAYTCVSIALFYTISLTVYAAEAPQEEIVSPGFVLGWLAVPAFIAEALYFLYVNRRLSMGGYNELA